MVCFWLSVPKEEKEKNTSHDVLFLQSRVTLRFQIVDTVFSRGDSDRLDVPGSYF